MPPVQPNFIYTDNCIVPMSKRDLLPQEKRPNREVDVVATKEIGF